MSQRKPAVLERSVRARHGWTFLSGLINAVSSFPSLLDTSNKELVSDHKTFLCEFLLLVLHKKTVSVMRADSHSVTVEEE